jgi:nucleotide-binding universal stress UspA family protein
MTRSPSPPASILVDVALPDPSPLSPALVDLLASLRIVLVGWYAVPEQTSPEQAREQFGEQAAAALDRIARPFEEAGAEVRTRLVFTGNQLDTISRISTEEECDAVLIPARMGRLERLLVPLRGLHNARRIAPLVADLVRGPGPAQDGTAGNADREATTDVTLLHVLEKGESDVSSREQVLQPAADLMTEQGIDADRLRLETVTAEDPARTILDIAAHYDAVVLGETKPTVREILFGSVPEQIVESVQVPVIMVRQEHEEAGMAERATQTT